MEKLYRVKLVRVMYILAPDENSAEIFAKEARSNTAEITECKITKATRETVMNDNWSDSEPWGIKSNLTCRKLLEGK